MGAEGAWNRLHMLRAVQVRDLMPLVVLTVVQCPSRAFSSLPAVAAGGAVSAIVPDLVA